MDFGRSSHIPNVNPSSREKGLGEMELDAARALVDFKQMSKIERRSRDSNESRSEHVDLVGYNPQDNKDAEAPAEERINVEHDSELSISSISCANSHVFCFGRRMELTEAEGEAKRIRRVIANRESARQTIQRRQALREKLIKRVAELSRENQDMKMEKELARKEYLSLKDRNKELKEQMVKAMKSEGKVGAEIMMRHVASSSSSSPSTELSLVAPWPSISSSSVPCYEEGGSSNVCGTGTPFFVPSCAWVYPSLHETSEFHPSSSHASGDKDVDSTVNTHESGHCLGLGDNLDRLSLHIGCKTNVLLADTAEEDTNAGINLEEMPVGFDQHNEISEHDPGGDEVMNPCPTVEDEQELGAVIDTKVDQVGSIVAEKAQVTSNLWVMRLVDPTVAAAARRRKELTRLKYLHGKQIRLQG